MDIQCICQECGKTFVGTRYSHFCEICMRKRKQSSTIRMRVCQDCGIKFMGGPRAKRCPNCREIAYKEHNKKSSVAKRKLGSIDVCKMCGKEYVVNSGRQKYCKECARTAILEWQKEHKKDYEKNNPEQRNQKYRKRAQQKKLCKYCLREIHSRSDYCSEYCKKEAVKIQSAKSDMKRGGNRNIEKYMKKREEYRRMVKDEQQIIL